jgi:hypothetical protein
MFSRWRGEHDIAPALTLELSLVVVEC